MTVNPNRIKAHLEKISITRDIFENPKSLRSVENYIQQEFESYGYLVEKQTFSFEGHDLNNLIARLPVGANFNPPLVDSSPFVVGAHFDAVPGTPGADDNASGVAAMLESARLWALRVGTGLKPSPTGQIEFVAFNAEEYGMIGSKHYVKSLVGLQRKVTGMISLEMLGYTSYEKGSQQIPFFLKPFYPNVGNFLAVVGDTNSIALIKKAKAAFLSVGAGQHLRNASPLPVQTLTVPFKGNVIPACRLSDHSPFWDNGLPALLVTDTSFFRNPHYHSPQDKLETLDLDFLHRITEGVAQLLFSI